MLGEFDFISRYFAPLAEGAPGSYGLRNDAALLSPLPGEAVVTTVDTLISGVHFLPDDPADLVARKALRVSLSDLASMGASPLGYLLALALPQDSEESWLADFSAGLAADQEIFGLHLLGGDTTRTSGPVTLSITAFGSVPQAQALGRHSARAGDLLYMSGTLGDGALGLRVLLNQLSVSQDADKYLASRYHLPQPRMDLGLLLRDHATACLDISDGLLADLGHLCRQSALAARLQLDSLPLSEAAREALAGDPGLLESVVTGGDDYELLFSLSPDRQHELLKAAEKLSVSLHCIGSLEAGQGVELLDRHGCRKVFAKPGWTHF
ncbi:thiamine-phosphate kinase [Rhodovibrionaceae bacterium A322]